MLVRFAVPFFDGSRVYEQDMEMPDTFVLPSTAKRLDGPQPAAAEAEVPDTMSQLAAADASIPFAGKTLSATVVAKK